MSSTQLGPQLERMRVRRAFDRAAHRYDTAAAVQRHIAQQLRSYLPEKLPTSNGALLDLGCGTGQALQWLQSCAPTASNIALDFAPAMLQQVQQRNPNALAICADMQALPLADNSVQLAWSSLALQWCNPYVFMREIARVLQPNGQALIATLGPDTLCQLRKAFQGLDQFSHVREFANLLDVQQAALQAGLAIEVLHQSPYVVHRPNLRAILNDLKGIGANSSGPQQRRRMLGRAAWQQVERQYEAQREADGLPVTYDLLLARIRKLEA